MRTNSFCYGSRAFAAWIGAAAILGTPSIAEARTELLRWTHSDPGNVASFKVYFGTASGAFDTLVDAGMPAPDSEGVFSFALQVPPNMENENLYITMTALDDQGRESLYSNEKIREAPAPGAPSGEPAPAATLGEPGKPMLVQ